MKAAELYGYRNVSKDDDKVKQNLMQVNVYFKTLNTHMVTESEYYDGNTIIYAFGGALSLYLGISLAMVFEIFEWIIDTFLNLMCPTKRKTRVSSKSDTRSNSGT